MKTIHALLLFAIIAAGAATITTDAYAQSNTQRLSSIQETVEEIQTGLNQLLMPVNGTGGDTISSAITGFSGVLDSIKETAESTQQSVNNLAVLVVAMGEDIDGLKSSLSTQDGTTLSDNLDFLTNVVNRNHVNLSDRLDTIELAMAQMESTLGNIERRLSTTSGTPTPGTGTSPVTVSPGGGLIRDTATLDVTAYIYKSAGTKQTVGGDTVYDLDMTFSCNMPVSVDTVSTDVDTSLTEVIPNASPHVNTDRNYLTVDGRDLYDSRFEISSTNYVAFIRSVLFNPEPLPLGAGDVLRFDSQQHEVSGKIDASTRNNPGFGYTISVTYLADRNTTCAFNTGSGSPVGALAQSGTLNIPATMTSDTLIRNFSDRVSCGNNPVEITSMQASVVGNWQSTLAGFAEFDLTFIDGSNDDSPDHRIGFADNGTLADTSYPIRFSNADLQVSGKIPGEDIQLLIQINYNTVQGGSCRIAN